MVDTQDFGKEVFISLKDCRICGPYTRKDGRQILTFVKGKKRTSISYPKYIMEQYLGRKLNSNESVHHKDGNFLNNDIANMEVLSIKEHAKLDSLMIIPIKMICPICKKSFILRKDQRKTRMKKKAGPFCSKKCTGIYGSSVQNGGKKLSRKRYKTIKIKTSKFEPINGNINSGVGNIGESPAEKRGNTEGTHESENAVETRCPTT